MDQQAGTVPGDRQRVMVGVDCSRLSVRVLREAARVAAELGAGLDVVFGFRSAADYPWLWPAHIPPAQAHDHVHDVLVDLVRDAFGPDRPASMSLDAVEGDPVATLLARSAAARLVVVGGGAPGQPPSSLGAVGRALVARSSVPVLVVHAAAQDLVAVADTSPVAAVRIQRGEGGTTRFEVAPRPRRLDALLRRRTAVG